MNYLTAYAKWSALMLGLVMSLATHAGDTQTTTQLTINNDHLLQSIVNKLESRFRYVITFEDAPYNYEGDLHIEMVNGQRSVRPEGGTLSLTVPASPSIDVPTMASILNQLVQVQANRGVGGHFRVLQAGDVFHVVPTEVRDKNGDWVAHTPLLDTPISVPEANYELDAMIDAICKALSLAAQVPVTQALPWSRGSSIGIRPPTYHLGAHNERARDVLMRALALIDTSDAPYKDTYELWYGTGLMDGLTDCSKPDCGRYYSLQVGLAY